MLYIIDANNLAGKLNLLEEDNFDKKLFEIIQEFFSGKKNEIFLVYDSADLMGDKFTDGFVNVVYTPRDSFYNSADDKILELAEDYARNKKDELAVVTDDLEIIDKIEKMKNMTGLKRIKIIKATDFAKLINYKSNRQKPEEKASDDDSRGLSDKNIDNINDELLKIWKQ
jgi:predicted RNA-binding protein with PIN domain